MAASLGAGRNFHAVGNGIIPNSSKRRKLDSTSTVALQCLVCKEPFRRRHDLWQHLTTSEKGVNVFVCLNCGRGFCRDRLLRNHSCDRSDCDPQTNQVGRRTGFSVFCHIIACDECGSFVALVNIENPSWKNYSVLCSHPSRSFRKITLYSWTADTIRFIKNDLSIPCTVSVGFGPSVSGHIPLGCKFCGEKYTQIDDIESHVWERHEDQLSPVHCEQCQARFSSPLLLQLHANDEHGGEKLHLLDFLSNAVVEDPYVEQTILGRAGSYFRCDLCAKDILGTEFNSHDCATNYVRRYLSDGKVILCHSVKIQDFAIDMGIQDPMLLSLAKKSQCYVELCLKFYAQMNLPKLDDFKEEQIYSCKHCEFIFVNQSLFREHVTEMLQSEEMDFQWPTMESERNSALANFGLPVRVTEKGLICPKCATMWCSPAALERHTKASHSDSFEVLTIRPTRHLAVIPSGAERRIDQQCFICNDELIGPRMDLKTHIRDRHMFICYSCGSCFVSQIQLDLHQSTVCRRGSGTSVGVCYCTICREVFLVLSEYYQHLVWQHPSEILHDRTVGQLMPTCGLVPQAKSTNTNGFISIVPLEDAPVIAAPDRKTSEIQNGHRLGKDGGLSGSLSDDDCQVIETIKLEVGEGTTSDEITGVDEEVVVCESEPSTSTSRTPTHGCDYCSQKFFTLKAAEEHRRGHAHDVGETTTFVLPVPDGLDVHICRLCCLAYESRSTYEKHMRNHKLIVECDQCSAVCLNASHRAGHVEAHRQGSLVYGCYTCSIATRTEAALLIHMNESHRLPLVWFCKWCGVANSDWTKMISHFCIDSKGTPRPQLVLPTSKLKLHYQPSGEVGSCVTKKGQVAECVHRSFLGCKEPACACSTCGSIIAAAAYLLTISDRGTTSNGSAKLSVVDEAYERSLTYSHPFFKRIGVLTSLQLNAPKMMVVTRPATGPQQFDSFSSAAMD